MLIIKLAVIAVILAIAVMFFLKTRREGFFSRRPAPAFRVRRKRQVIHLDHQTAIEKSWLFFAAIIDRVKTQFSAVDRQAVLKIGMDLEQAGVKYFHVIDPLEIRKIMTPAVTKEQQKAGPKR